MRVRRTLATLFATLVAGTCLLSACGGGTSVADPPVSGSPTTSTPTTQVPGRESPEHFIRRWAIAEKRMENTGKTGAYLALSRGCKACHQLAEDINRFYLDGGYAKWGGWHIRSISREDSASNSMVYDVNVHSLPTTYKEAADGSIKHLRGGDSTHQLTLRANGDSWLVVQKAQLAG